MSQGARRQSREIALQLLFQTEFLGTNDFSQSLEVFKSNFEAPANVWDYAESLLTGIHREKVTLDQTIESHSSHWKIPRMALVDVNILRIATYEIIYLKDTVPPHAAINEAVEISKKYGGPDSSAFVNGILDQIASTKS